MSETTRACQQQALERPVLQPNLRQRCRVCSRVLAISMTSSISVTSATSRSVGMSLGGTGTPGPPAITVSEYVSRSLPNAFVARISKLNVPEDVGVPLSTPFGASVIPGGSVPEKTENVIGVDPVALMPGEYGTPAVAGDSGLVVVIVRGMPEALISSENASVSLPNAFSALIWKK